MPRPTLPDSERRDATEFTMLRRAESEALSAYCAETGHSRSTVLRLALLAYKPLASLLPRPRSKKRTKAVRSRGRKN